MDPATRSLDRRALLTVASAAFTVALAGCGAEDADVPIDDTNDPVDEDDGDVADEDHTGDPVDDADDADQTDDERPTPGLAPEEALETFALPDGWTIELVAAEPQIDSPVDVKWDARGRLWVVEMPDYMAHSPADEEGEGEVEDTGYAQRPIEELHGWGDEITDAEPNGAVKLLEDTDGDGRMDAVTTRGSSKTHGR